MFRRIHTVLCLPLFLVAACATQKPAQEEPALARSTPVAAAKTEPVPASTRDAVAQVVANLKRVHFLFDSPSMTDDSRNALLENAKILAAHPAIRVEIEGHCDERGTTEYNLALGDRRAEAVRKYLVTSGVAASRVRTISLGKEKPLSEGHGESVWAQNRRAEFRVVALNDLSVVGGSVP